MSEREIRFKKDFILFYQMLGGMLFAHLFYAIFFYSIGSIFMTVLNIISTLFYTGLFILFFVTNNTSVLKYLLFEIIIHAFFAAIVIGPNSGFELFLICTAFASHHVVRITNSSKILAYLTNSFVCLLLLTLRVLPKLTDLSSIQIYPKQSYLDLLYVVNLVIISIMIFYIMLVFLKGIENDEAKLRQLNSRLSELASRDSLTQLLNRRAMKIRLEAALDFRRKSNTEFVTAIADIDNFKKINDLYGHDCGDKVLKRVVQAIKENVRESDYISRWGGDEILILFSRSTLEGASTCIERIHKEIANSVFLYNDETINLTITIGVCSSKNFTVYQDIILEADRRLYDGKHNGKNCIIYDSPLTPVTDS